MGVRASVFSWKLERAAARRKVNQISDVPRQGGFLAFGVPLSLAPRARRVCGHTHRGDRDARGVFCVCRTPLSDYVHYPLESKVTFKKVESLSTLVFTAYSGLLRGLRVLAVADRLT